MRLLIVLLLLLGLGGGGVYVLSQQEPPAAAGLKPVVASATAAKSFDAKVDSVQAAIDEAKRTGQAKAVEVTFTEEELTSKAAAAATTATGGLVATNPQIHLSGGNIIATSSVSIQGFQLNVGVVATPVVEDGKTKIVVKEIQTGAIPIPDAIKKLLESQIGAAIDPKALGIGIDVTKLQVVDGKLVLAGTAKP